MEAVQSKDGQMDNFAAGGLRATKASVAGFSTDTWAVLQLKTKGQFHAKRASDAEDALEAARRASYEQATPVRPQAAR